MVAHFIKYHIKMAALKRIINREELDCIIRLCAALKGELKR